MNLKSLLIALVMLALCNTQSKAQFATAAAYPFVASSKTFTYLVGGTQIVGLYTATPPGIIDDDATISSIPLGFTFKFAGTNYTTVSVSSNGFLSFTAISAGSGLQVNSLTNVTSITPSLMPMWGDLMGNVGPNGSVSYLTTGVAPNRLFTMEWKNWGWFSSTPASVANVFSFQVLVYENGNIEYRYKPEANNPPSSAVATIGIAKSGTDYQTLPTTGTSPTPSSSTFTATINSIPAANQSYFWGCNIPITVQPRDTITCNGTVTYTAAATGTGLTYQWMVDPNTGTYANITNGGVYSGATTATLTITGATTAMNNYKYSCLIGNGTCSIPTDGAKLSTGTTATAISTQPAAKTTVCQSSNATISLVAAGTGLTYQWQVDPNTGTFANITNNTVYSGATTNALLITATPLANNNYKYRCLVNGACVPLALTSNPDTLLVNAQPVITTQPPTQSSFCPNAANTITVAATGATTYTWQVDPNTGTFGTVSNGGIYSNATTTALTITNPTSTNNNYKYRLQVNNAANCPLNSNPDTLTVLTLASVTTHPPKNTLMCNGTNNSIVAAGTGSGLTYQWQVDALTGTYVNLTNTPPYGGVNTGTLSFTAPTTAINGYRYRCVLGGTCNTGVNTTPDTVTVYTAPAITVTPLDKSVCNGNNAVFVVKATGGQLAYQWQERTPTSAFSNLSNSALYKGTTTDTLTVNAATLTKNQYQYQCVISGYCPVPVTTAPVTLFVNDYTAVTYITPSVATCDSVNTQMYVQAAGSGLTYQWQLNPGTSFSNISNSGTYSGVNSDTLRITNPTGILSGNLYRVVVNGVCGNPVNSDPVPLTVNAFPKLQSQPQDDSVGVGQQASFSVTAIGTAVTYQWQVDELDASGYQNLFDNLAYSGTHTNTLTINGTYLTKNGYLYRCIAQGLCGVDDTSAPAKLGVGVDTASTVAGLSYHAGVTIYPNPVKGNEMIIKMDHVSDKDIYLKIVDQLGRVVFAENIHLAHDNTATVNVSKLLPGIYTIQLSDQFYNQVRSLRFSKE